MLRKVSYNTMYLINCVVIFLSKRVSFSLSWDFLCTFGQDFIELKPLLPMMGVPDQIVLSLSQLKLSSLFLVLFMLLVRSEDWLPSFFSCTGT